jgi:hypothetical protein
MTSKKCRSCKEVKPETEFYSAGRTTLAGKIIRDTLCKPCKILYKKERHRKIKSFIESHKTKCEKCGYSQETHESFQINALAFHHVRGEKSFNIADAIGRGCSMEKIQEEINKCVILCTRCHAEIHANER